MKLITALEIGKDCGLDTVGEAFDNIDIHAMNIFAYDQINKEINELYNEIKEKGIGFDESIDNWLTKI